MSAKKIKHNHNHCCSAKQCEFEDRKIKIISQRLHKFLNIFFSDYSNEKENLVKTLQITPRVIFYKQSLKLQNDYEAKVHLVNKGLVN